MIFEQLLEETKIPDMVPVKYHVKAGNIKAEQISDVIRKSLEDQNLLERIGAGKTVALTCGSREICNINIIIKSIADLLKGIGAKPFIFPAMGSHGGATAEGQMEIL